MIALAHPVKTIASRVVVAVDVSVPGKLPAGAGAPRLRAGRLHLAQERGSARRRFRRRQPPRDSSLHTRSSASALPLLWAPGQPLPFPLDSCLYSQAAGQQIWEAAQKLAMKRHLYGPGKLGPLQRLNLQEVLARKCHRTALLKHCWLHRFGRCG